MSLLTNQNLINRISTEYGIEQQLNPSVARTIQALVEAKTRALLDVAVKFMTQNHRDEVTVEDLQCSLSYMSIDSIRLLPSENSFKQIESGSVRRDPMHHDVEELIRSELKGLNHQFKKPIIKGRWIYIEGRIPKTSQNMNIKNMQEILQLKHKVEEERSRKFNLIKNQPIALYTSQEEEYFKKIVQELEEGRFSLAIPKSNLNTLFPMLLNYVLSMKATDNMVRFLLQLLLNAYLIRRADTNSISILQPHLHTLAVYLMSYEGRWAFESGIILARLVEYWKPKYANFPSIYDVPDNSYCTRLKKLAYSLVGSGGQYKITPPETLVKDVNNKVFMAEYYAYIWRRVTRRKAKSGNMKQSVSLMVNSEDLAGIQSDNYLELSL